MEGIAFGPTIRLLRQAKGISLREMARQLGVSPAFLSQIEAGRQHKIPKARIVQVADMLGVSEGYLLGTARQVHPDLIKFLSETPEAAEFMVAAMKSGLVARDFNLLRNVLADKKQRSALLRSKPAGARANGHSLDEFVDSSLCMTGISVQNKDRLFRRFTKAVSKKHKNVSTERLLSSLEARERQAATSVGGGVAIPHAFVPDLDKPIIGAFVLSRSIKYGPESSDRARTVFFLVGPEDKREMHLPILARIARLCSTPEFLDVLGKAKSGREVYKTILNWDKRISA